MTALATATYWRSVPTPAGDLLLIADGDEIRSEWAALYAGRRPGAEDTRLLPEVAAWIRAALREDAGPPPAAVSAGPPYFRACWKACRRIGVGRTKTYAQLARAARRPTAIRAAGGAMRANPQPLLTPCHRVLATTGLGGFSGTRKRGVALDLKATLLRLEAQLGC